MHLKHTMVVDGRFVYPADHKNAGRLMGNGGFTVCLVPLDGSVYWGVSVCSPSETFCRAEGRRRARLRAVSRWERDRGEWAGEIEDMSRFHSFHDMDVAAMQMGAHVHARVLGRLIASVQDKVDHTALKLLTEHRQLPLRMPQFANDPQAVEPKSPRARGPGVEMGSHHARIWVTEERMDEVIASLEQAAGDELDHSDVGYAIHEMVCLVKTLDVCCEVKAVRKAIGRRVTKMFRARYPKPRKEADNG